MTDQNFKAVRDAMVESQLRTSDVSDVRVIAAMAHVPREDYVPAERRAQAYIDRPVRLAGDRAINPPLATGRLLTEAAIKPDDSVLLIGAASGYSAAVVKAMGAKVVAVEEDAALAGPDTVIAPLAAGAPDKGPYDVIVIDGAVERLPDAIVAQLAEGGRLTAGLIDRGVARIVVGRKAGGTFGVTSLIEMEMVALPGFAEPARFIF